MADAIHNFRDWAQREESKLVEWWYDFCRLCWLQDRGLWPYLRPGSGSPAAGYFRHRRGFGFRNLDRVQELDNE